MEHLKSKTAVLSVFCVLLPLFLLLLSYQTILFFTELTPAQENIFYFLQGKEPLRAGFTQQESSHLEDVTSVMISTNIAFYVLLLIITIIFTYYKKDKELLLKLVGYGGKTTLLAMIIIGGVSFLFFDTAFTLFHQIFFPRGNWLFSPDSVLIQTFPMEFFITISRNIFLLTLGWGILFILIAYYYRYAYHHGN